MPTLSTIEAVLDRLRPVLRADGGNLEFVELAGWVARVRFTGACAACPTSHLTLHMGVEAALRRLHPSLRVALVS